MEINLIIYNDWFEEPVEIIFEWDSSSLPRIGENIHPSVWIDEFDFSNFERNIVLSREAIEAINRDKMFPSFSYQEWLYDICNECDCITSISYRKGKDKKIYAFIILQKGKL